MGRSGKSSWDEVHHHHVPPSRWFCDVRFKSLGLEYRSADVLQEGPAETACRGMSSPGHQAFLLLLAIGLAQPRLLSARGDSDLVGQRPSEPWRLELIP